MTPEKAKNTMCPFTFNQNPVSVSSEKSYMCVADKCMAWKADNDDEGHCELIHGISGWISRIANRM